jgi:hypothetical protein
MVELTSWRVRREEPSGQRKTFTVDKNFGIIFANYCENS